MVQHMYDPESNQQCLPFELDPITLDPIPRISSSPPPYFQVAD